MVVTFLVYPDEFQGYWAMESFSCAKQKTVQGGRPLLWRVRTKVPTDNPDLTSLSNSHRAFPRPVPVGRDTSYIDVTLLFLLLYRCSCNPGNEVPDIPTNFLFSSPQSAANVVNKARTSSSDD